MIAAFKKLFLYSARLCKFHNLVFFALIATCSCASNDETAIRVVWIDGKAAALYLPKKLLNDIPDDSLKQFLKISLKNNKEATAILGELKLQSNIIFEPLIPFTPGSSYEVFYMNDLIGAFNVPAADAKNFPELTSFYPKQDTLPENVLKLYLAFSHPMKEGSSEKYITLIKNNTDTLRDEFLNLQPELWNENRTVLTIWFDPGRIKRDLQPNLKLGVPLKESVTYKLVISHNWPDAQGVALQKDFIKFFVAGKRDSLSPNTDHWKLLLPAKKTLNALTIVADETLDHYLFAECLRIKDKNGMAVKGIFEMDDKDNSCRFFPAAEWRAGNYSLMVESKLEDLAGNNLNRPFDRDITQGKEPLNKDSYEIKFEIF